ncbi:phytoene synthase [Afipia sp. P52-10]|jgi:phytoene synthase|uniref:phytoene/squalene synthase family protein n=1 Tax=Afipia sp. P52-10 TaxID=1429916 RepID=UPI0003DF1F1F|nr:phytoene/squalene synthase family protein [Afipia sp. P52-10]ETR75237.1 phytoene synthase [Afipia sp. P52-10]
MSGATGRNEADAAYCAGLVRESDFERYAATLFVTPEHRRALLSLYAFNIEIARVREQISQALAGEIRLQWWHDLLSGTAHGEATGNPVAAELLQVIERHQLARAPLKRLIDAHRFDLYDEPMQTMADFRAYLQDTASALQSLGVKVLAGDIGTNDAVCRDAGLAIGIARIIEAMPRHAARGQIYLPVESLAAFQVDPHVILQGRATEELLALLRNLAAEARTHLQDALAALPDVPKPARRVFLPLVMAGRALDRIEATGYDPFAPQPVSRLRLLTSMWLKARSFDRL